MNNSEVVNGSANPLLTEEGDTRRKDFILFRDNCPDLRKKILSATVSDNPAHMDDATKKKLILKIKFIERSIEVSNSEVVNDSANPLFDKEGDALRKRKVD